MTLNPVSFAQTNIQIYNQMKLLEYDDRDIEKVRCAYVLAMRLFSGQFRANEKPQLAHLIGVASILAAQKAKGHIVAAGMLHSAYSHGEWGDSLRGRTDTKASEIRNAVGKDAEALVSCYQSQRYTTEHIRSLRGKFDTLSELERDALLVELADVLEEFVDSGIKYCDHVKHGPESGNREAVQFVTVETAAVLRYPDLARDLSDALDRLDHFRAPPPAHTHEKHGSFVPPLTHTPTVRLALKQCWRSVAQLISR